MRIDFDKLKAARPAFYRIVVGYSGFREGTHDIEPDVFPAATQRGLTEWAASERARVERSTQPAAPAASPTPPAPAQSVEPPVSPAVAQPAVASAPVEPQINIAEYERQQLQRATDEARGLARLRQFQQEQGLCDCKENADAIRDWLDQNVMGYVSSEGIDAAISNLGARGKNVLLWDSKAPPAAPPPTPEPEEVLRTLPDGTKQLPLDQPITPNASKEQARDYLKRLRAQQPYARSSGSFGSKF